MDSNNQFKTVKFNDLGKNGSQIGEKETSQQFVAQKDPRVKGQCNAIWVKRQEG